MDTITLFHGTSHLRIPRMMNEGIKPASKQEAVREALSDLDKYLQSVEGVEAKKRGMSLGSVNGQVLRRFARTVTEPNYVYFSRNPKEAMNYAMNQPGGEIYTRVVFKALESLGFFSDDDDLWFYNVDTCYSEPHYLIMNQTVTSYHHGMVLQVEVPAESVAVEMPGWPNSEYEPYCPSKHLDNYYTDYRVKGTVPWSWVVGIYDWLEVMEWKTDSRGRLISKGH